MTLSVPGKAHQTSFSDNFLWLEPGETTEITVDGAEAADVEIEGMNLL